MKLLKCLIPLALLSCSKPTPHFTVNADLPQIGTQAITVVYTTGDGNRHALPVTAVDGKFDFEGASEDISLIEIFTSTGQLYAALLAQNGDNIHLQGTQGDFKIDGNDLAQALVNYSQGTDTAGMPAEVRHAIESIYLTPTLPSAKFIAPEVFVQKDSVYTYPPEGIWVFTASEKERTPALLDTLRYYAKKKGVNVRDIYIGSEMWAWHTIIRQDSATWTQALSPDAPVALSGILTTTPLILEVDTTGRIIRRAPL